MSSGCSCIATCFIAALSLVCALESTLKLSYWFCHLSTSFLFANLAVVEIYGNTSLQTEAELSKILFGLVSSLIIFHMKTLNSTEDNACLGLVDGKVLGTDCTIAVSFGNVQVCMFPVVCCKSIRFGKISIFLCWALVQICIADVKRLFLLTHGGNHGIAEYLLMRVICLFVTMCLGRKNRELAIFCGMNIFVQLK